MTPPFDGYVLTGGRSSRMGADKALLGVAGRTLAECAAAALVDAASVTYVGGDEAALRSLGRPWIADEEDGSGPLVGLRTALRHAQHDAVVVLSCDLPRIGPRAVGQIVHGLSTADSCVPLVRGRHQWMAAGWRREPTLAACRQAERAGSTSVRDMAQLLSRNVLLPSVDHWFVDVDTPDELMAITGTGTW